MQSALKYRACAALILCPLLGSAAEAQNIPVFIFSGQSNMVGFQTNSGDLTVAQQQQQSTVFFTNRNPFDVPVTWSQLQPPTGSDNHFGPEIAAPLIISHSLLGQDVAVVKFAHNDSSLQQTDDLADWEPTNNELYLGMTTE